VLRERLGGGEQREAPAYGVALANIGRSADDRTAIMDKKHFRGFAAYLADTLPTIPVHLQIRKSRFCRGVNQSANGIENVLAAYVWKSQWRDDQNEPQRSSDWASTRASLRRLHDGLKAAVNGSETNDSDVLKIARRVLEWGGNRNWKVGAFPFLTALAENNNLKTYLHDCTKAFDLVNNKNRPSLHSIREMNSMLTKIHALLATDGLPIYDSRVAAAIATLAEQYRRTTKLIDLPESIRFPTVDGNIQSIRHVVAVYPDAVRPFKLNYADPNRIEQWTCAKWKLGKLIRLTLTKNALLFQAEGDLPARCHAFEAALFMLGYDPTCLRSVDSDAAL
jgi:hypothetical protein